MSCILATGRKLPCKDTIGGISEVLFADYGTLGTITYTGLNVTAFSEDPTFFKWDVKSASGLEQTINQSAEQGTTYYEQVVTMVLTKLDQDTAEELMTLINGRAHCFIKTNNGDYLSVGITRGCDFSGSFTTGMALGDLSGFTITVTAQEPMPSMYVSSSVIIAGTSATQIDA
jgi:hypothetical protein